MSEVIDLSDAPDAIRDLVSRSRDEPIIFVEGNRQVAILSPSAAPVSEVTNHRLPGQMKGRLKDIVEDDEHLEGFKDYMPCSCCSTLTLCSG